MRTLTRLCCAMLCATTAGARVYVVDQNHPAASDSAEGTAANPFRTIARAAVLAGPGDTVLIWGAIYRECVRPARGGTSERPVTYTAGPGQTVWVKGSEVWRPTWEPVAGQQHVYRARIDRRLLGDRDLYRIGFAQCPTDRDSVARPAQGDVWPRTLGQLFVDDQPFTELDRVTEVYAVERTWLVSRDGDAIIAHFPRDAGELDGLTVELTVRDQIFAPSRRGLGYIHLEGLCFEHCGNQCPFPQAGAVSTRSGHHWLIRNCTIRHAKTVGLDCGSEYWIGHGAAQHRRLRNTVDADQRLIIGGHHLIAGNHITDNGECGIAGWSHRGTRVVANVVERNNCLGFRKAIDGVREEYAGIKFHLFSDGLIEGNLVRDNGASGIWLDHECVRSRITRNLVLGNHRNGIFIEFTSGPLLIDNNVVAFSQAGDGIYAHDASKLTIAHNLVSHNSQFGVLCQVVSDRKHQGKLAEASEIAVVGNLILGNSRGAVNMPFPTQRSRSNTCDYNVMTSGSGWAGRQAPWFQVNALAGRVKWQTIVQDFREKLSAADVPDEDWPNLKHWPKLKLMSLNQWRILTGFDEHSLAAQVRLCLRPQICVLSMDLGKRARAMACPSVTGVERDFFGRRIDPDHALPGPFQRLGDGMQHLCLWPVVAPRP